MMSVWGVSKWVPVCTGLCLLVATGWAVAAESVFTRAAPVPPVEECSAAGQGLQRPWVARTVPGDGVTGIPRDIAIAADLVLPNCGGGVAGSTLSDSTVRLIREADGVSVPGTVNTTGGADAIVFQPSEPLSAEQWYRYEVTEAVRDARGQPFLPFSMRFRTSKSVAQASDPRIRFQTPTVVFDGSASANAGVPRPNGTLTMGPDGRLYAGGLDGVVRRWSVAEDGQLGPLEEWSGLAGRVIIGLAFDPHPERRHHLWVSHNAPLPATPPQADFTGTLTRLSVSVGPGAPFRAVRQDYLVGLPRSALDHMSNSLAFNPATGKLYLAQGSNTAMGAPDRAWFQRPERLLTAAILEIDPTRTHGLPFDVKTENEDGSTFEGAYNPWRADAVARIYASGIRNSYDLLWHSNGHLYTAVNGSAAGGNAPASPEGTTPAVPALNNVGTQDDFLVDVIEGGYFGHPNPRRGEYVLNGGNPTPFADFAEVVPSGSNGGYPVGVSPDPNFRREGIIWNFGRNRSPNGMLEYASDAFGGALRGRLLVVEFSGGDDILALGLEDGTGRVKAGAVHVIARQLGDPLDLAEHLPTGALFVSQLLERGRDGGRILLLRPCTDPSQPGCAAPREREPPPETNSTSGRAPTLELTQPDALPSPDWLVFNGYSSKPSHRDYQARTHATLQVGNAADASGPLTLERLETTEPWRVVSPTNLPLVLAPGQTVDIVVEFAASGGKRVWYGTLALHSSDGANPVRTVQLAGIWMTAPEGSNELTFVEGMKVFGYSTVFVHPGQDINNQGRVETVGEEVLVPIWERADSSRPVRVRQLAAFRNYMLPEPASGAYFEWEDLSGGVDRGRIRTLFVTENKDCQRLLPRLKGTDLPAEGTFSPPGPFRFMIDGVASSDPSRFYAEYPQYFPNCQGACGHTFRVFPLRDRAGVPVPDTYVMTMDFAGGNYDYNDNTYLLENVRPRG